MHCQVEEGPREARSETQKVGDVAGANPDPGQRHRENEAHCTLARARREIDTREGVSAAMTRAVLCQRRIERAAALDDEVTSQTSSPEADDRSGDRSDPQRGPRASSWKRDPARGSRIVTNAPEVGSVVKKQSAGWDRF
jgi:hypothetical protein